MPDFDWKSALLNVAPGIAMAFGGPAGPALGVAVKVLGEALLGKPNASKDEVEAALSRGLSGEQVVQLRQAEQTFALEMERIQADLEKAALLDVQSARRQTVELAQADSRISWAPVVISIVIVLGFFGAVYLLFFIERTWDERTANLLNVLFGALTVSFTQVANYWLGSSAGSKRAGDAVRKIAENSTR